MKKQAQKKKLQIVKKDGKRTKWRYSKDKAGYFNTIPNALIHSHTGLLEKLKLLTFQSSPFSIPVNSMHSL